MTDNTSHLPLNSYQSNVHSQNGEDGVIDELLRRLHLNHSEQRWCVEFGAWDGIHLSNTFALVEQGWRAVYIEGESDRYSSLVQTAKRYPRIIPVHAFVARFAEEKESLDNLLSRTPIPSEFDVLSIDIDSYDCDVWESLTRYRPRIVVIEINSNAPPGVLWRHSIKTPGSTFSSTVNVGVKKGYTAVCHTGNLLFVRNDFIPSVNLPQRYIDYPELLFVSKWLPSKLFVPRPSKALGFSRLIPRPLRAIVDRIYRLLRGRGA